MKSKKVLSVLTAAVLAAGMTAVPAAADTVTDAEEIQLGAVKYSPDVTDSGEYETMGWSFYENGDLVIYSAGYNKYDLPDFSESERPPFEKYRLRIKNVYFSEYVEKIGDCTFRNYTNLKGVHFDNNGSWGYSRLKTIGNGAFEGCTSLKKFSVPFTTEAIGSNAFRNCSSMTHFKFGLTCSVGTDAFTGCPLSHIDILKGYSSDEFCSAGSGLPSDSSLYHSYTATVSPYSTEDVFKKYGETDEEGNISLRAPSFDRCETADCILNTLGKDDLEINYTPENIKLRTLKNGMTENEYCNSIDMDASEEFYSIYDPVNGRYLTRGMDYDMYDNYVGIAHSPETVGEAGYTILMKNRTNDYFFDDYIDIINGKNTVICYLNCDFAVQDKVDVQISNDTPSEGEEVSVKIVPPSGYALTKLSVESNYRNELGREILTTDKPECSFTAEGTNTQYYVVAELENTDKVSAFVERLYTTLLGRASEEPGKAEWTADIKNGRSAAEAASGFVLSEELKNQKLSNDEFVERMYLTFLDRTPDEEGEAGWVAVLDSGCSYAYILNSFAGSQEFRSICDSYGITAGSYESSEPRDKNVSLTSFVSRMYTKAIGRDYDVGGLNDWTGDYLAGKITADDIAYGFIGSQEFINKNLSNEDYVDTLYRTFFNREPDEGGRTGWLEALADGASRQEVLDGFLGAQEFINLKASFGV